MKALNAKHLRPEVHLVKACKHSVDTEASSNTQAFLGLSKGLTNLSCSPFKCTVRSQQLAQGAASCPTF